MKKKIDWKIFSILLGLSLASVVCVFPYVLTVQADVFSRIGQPIWIIFMAQFIQSAILFAFIIYFGLILTEKIDFHLPLLESISGKGKPGAILKDIVGASVLFGIAAAVAIYALDALFTHFGVSISTHQNYAPVWQKLLAAVYGGATEEILMRLFLMSFLIWIGMKIFSRSRPTKAGIIIPLVIAAVIFGLGHLPMTASLTKIDALVVIRAVVLNGIGGIIFGWLFWKKGLESAMIAHFTADVFLLTLLPLMFR